MIKGTGLPFKLISLLVVLAMLNTGCDLVDTILHALDRLCAMPEYVVTRVDDTTSGLCSATSCSLRQAVTTSNGCPGTHTIRIPAGTYRLTHHGANEDSNLTGDLDITRSVTIVGVGMPVLDGDAADRVFDIKSGASVTMTGLVIQNGQVEWGGGIMNAGNLTASQVWIRANHDLVGGSAAGVYNSGMASFQYSAFTENVSYEETAGIQNDGTLTLDNVTISGNRGYGVMNDHGGNTRVSYSTVADNPGAYELWNNDAPSTFTFGNSIVAGHVADGNCFGSLASGGFNIDSSSASSGHDCGLHEASDLNGIDPGLLPLGDYGGSTPSRSLQTSSPAVDSADPAHCGGTDQRGVSRPQLVACDRGAIEILPSNPSPNTLRTSTPTVTLTPTKTRVPAGSPTPTKTPLSTETPPAGAAVVASMVILNKNANCRKGPGTGYDIVTSLTTGTQTSAEGRDAQSLWLDVLVPNTQAHCWVLGSSVDLNVSLDSLPVLPTPPLPDVPANFTDKANCQIKLKSLSVKLSWSAAANAGGYHLYRGGNLLETLDANVTTYTDGNAPLGKDLLYELEAFNANGASARVQTTVSACK